MLVASHAVAFRIYKSLLAHHATIFNDMFSLGHSDVDGEETMDNVPVVHLADPPDALRIFLLILMSSGFRYAHHSIFLSQVMSDQRTVHSQYSPLVTPEASRATAVLHI